MTTLLTFHFITNNCRQNSQAILPTIFDSFIVQCYQE